MMAPVGAAPGEATGRGIRNPPRRPGAALELVHDVPNVDTEQVVDVPVAQLRPGPAIRTERVNAAHVRRLAECADSWPPIIVRQSDLAVVDGAHRVAAARLLQFDKIRAVYFEGDDRGALVASVRNNMNNGLPLTLEERRIAATDILRQHPEWADRRIAELCGLSPKTVAERRRSARAPIVGADAAKAVRFGRDGRARPVDRAAARARIIQALQEDPTASLREIAAVVGSSHETVRRVRLQMEMETTQPALVPEPPLSLPADIDIEDDEDELMEPFELVAAPRWSDDSACSSTGPGREFAQWFDQTEVAEDEWQVHMAQVPRGRIYPVVDEARRRANEWLAFARALERSAR
jgi:ParB-like chromosome segregation protein Spo0J